MPMMQVQVPANAYPGMLLTVQTPDGNTVNLTVPSGVAPNGMVLFEYGAQVRKSISSRQSESVRQSLTSGEFELISLSKRPVVAPTQRMVARPSSDASYDAARHVSKAPFSSGQLQLCWCINTDGISRMGDWALCIAVYCCAVPSWLVRHFAVRSKPLSSTAGLLPPSLRRL